MTRLIDRLAKAYPDSSKTTLKKWVVAGRVLVDGKIELAPHSESQGEISLGKKHAPKEYLPTLYEDAHIVVVEKPAGLLSVATEHGHENSAHRILKQRYKNMRVYPVQRIDRFVSGVLVYALSIEAKEKLKEQFAAHTIERVYLALVEGNVLEPGTWESLLVEDSNYKVHVSKNEGKHAVTHFRPIKQMKQTTLLEVTLETGRKNQIRVHCANNGHPIVGDTKYGTEEQPSKRIFLHARRLGFTHPITGKKMIFESKPPPRLT